MLLLRIVLGSIRATNNIIMNINNNNNNVIVIVISNTNNDGNYNCTDCINNFVVPLPIILYDTYCTDRYCTVARQGCATICISTIVLQFVHTTSYDELYARLQ